MKVLRPVRVVRAARRSLRWALIAALGAMFCVSSAAERAAAGARVQRDAAPLSPEQALGAFELEPGYRIELAAAEPLIRSPVAIAFDERGRMYVVENRGYPGALEGSPRPAPEGEIALLEDLDGDGRFDRRSTFARGLADPNGIMPWDGGVFVTAAPDLLYLKDTDGDRAADQRRVILTGFDASRTAQIRFSHPTLGIDNWIYLTSGLTGGTVTAPDHPDRPPVTFTRSDSRVHPVTHAFEVTGGQGQFGLTFDDHGRRFICANRNPVWHVVLEPRYLQRNPYLPFSATVQEVSAAGGDALVWPISADMTTASFHPSLMSTPHAGTFTAASGLHIHRGDALPAGHRGSLFICESAQNLVQRQVRSDAGVSFTTRPARTGREFLASRDQWFRPVFAANGPDGALYVVDMYRKFIDHPQYVPEGSRALLDFEAGKDRGRIYRLAAREWTRDKPPAYPATMGAHELAQAFEQSNGWWRDTAQRLLVERRDVRAAPAVRRIAADGSTAAARIHALWTLHGLGTVETADLAQALRDEHASVRENALRLVEERLRSQPDLLPHVLRLAGDPDARVRFRAALALGETDDGRALEALAAIGRRDGADRWARAAVLSSAGRRSSEFLRAFVAGPSPSAARGAVMQDLGRIFGTGESRERCLELVREITESADDSGWQPAALAGLAEGLRARGTADTRRSAFLALLEADSPQARTARSRVRAILSRASATALDEKAPMDLRLSAIDLMGHADGTVRNALEELLDPRHPSDIQVAAVRALTRLPGAEAAAGLIEARRWAAFTPRVRESILSALVSSEPLTAILLDALESQSIAPTALGAARRGRLLNHGNAAIQARARAVLAAGNAADRMQAYERLRPAVLERTGSAANGQRVFTAHCAPCHAFGGTGGVLGPDLSGIRNQPPEAILLHIMVPDHEITPGYQAYHVETRDGGTIVGRLESETPTTVTIRDATSRPHVILRSHVASMAGSARSLMPGELERSVSEAELADLIAYLKSAIRP